jgi:hypothetical protein
VTGILAEQVECAEKLLNPGSSRNSLVTALLVSHQLHARCGTRIVEAAARCGVRAELIALPPDPAARLPDAECGRLEAAFFSGDVFPDHSRQFFSAARKAPRLKWLHVFNAGVDHPIYTEMLERGVRLTTSAGSTAAPIAQTAIMGLLALARGFPPCSRAATGSSSRARSRPRRAASSTPAWSPRCRAARASSTSRAGRSWPSRH